MQENKRKGSIARKGLQGDKGKDRETKKEMKARKGLR